MVIRSWRRRVAAAVLLAATAGGCTGLEPALIGAAASAGSTTASVWNSGKLDVAVRAPGEACFEAAQFAAHRLSLRVTKIEPASEGRWKLFMRDGRNRLILGSARAGPPGEAAW